MSHSPTQKNAKKNKYWALVPAAGIGNRLGAKTPKQYLKLHGKEVLVWTLQTLMNLDFLEKIVLVLRPNDKYFSANLASEFPNILLVLGGEERQHSVTNGLQFLKDLADDDDWILVHDAARPCLTSDDVNKLVSGLQDDDVGGILASKVKDTLKGSDNTMRIASTLNRKDYWLAATPQLFRFKLLLDGLGLIQESGQIATDEASAIEAMGLPVKLIEGRSDNIKITSPEDVELAEFLLKRLGKVNV